MTNPNHNTNYQLYHGDCLEVMPTLPANSVDAVICDPPYGTTACSWDTVIPLDDMWDCIKHVLKPKGAVVLFGSEPFSSYLRLSNLKWYKYDWVWDKGKGTGFQIAKYRPMMQTENISIFAKRILYNPQMIKLPAPKVENFASSRSGSSPISNLRDGNRLATHRYPTNILKHKRDKQKLHPTQKPIALMEYLVKTYTNPAQTVLDFTMGSGTTGVACGKLGRNFVGIELLQEYYDIAETRIKNAYGDFALTEDEKKTGQMSLF